MNIGKALADYLKTVPAIAAAVSDHIYWPDTPDVTVLDHLRVSVVDGSRIHNLDVDFPIVQVSAYSKDAARLQALKEKVITVLRDARLVVDGTFVVSTLQDERTFRENSWWHAPMTFGLKYQEA